MDDSTSSCDNSKKGSVLFVELTFAIFSSDK
jgi:hypothetical protein